MISFSSYNIKYHTHPTEGWIMATGELRNESFKSYNTAVFRAHIFKGDEPMGSALIKINGFRTRMTKPFVATFAGVHHSLISRITRCDILLEATT